MLRKGAEAHLYRDTYLGLQAIRKHRIPKPYRHPELDREIRTLRTALEARLLADAKKSGILTPSLFLIDLEEATLLMELVKGAVLRDLVPNMSKDNLANTFCQLGRHVAQLHAGGMVHGDLTTSNVIVDGEGRFHMLDFGLGEYTSELEAKGVDLHLLLRTLESSHSDVAEDCWRHFQEGYSCFSEEAEPVLSKVKEIRRRGRYVEKRRQK